MDLRKNIFSALLLALGFILHQIMPAAIGGMKFDIQLAMLFIIIAVNMDLKNTIVTSLAAGIITAFTTTFPGGQIPNVIDKIVTSLVVYILFKLLTKFLSKQVSVIVVGFVGTIISGTVFLYSALLIVGLPLPFMALFATVVLPTAMTNIFLSLVLYNIVQVSFKAVKVSA